MATCELTLAELRMCRIAAQIAIHFLDTRKTKASEERIAEFQALIVRIDEEIGDTAEETGFHGRGY